MKCKTKRCGDTAYKRGYCLDHYINDEIRKQDYADSLKRICVEPGNQSTVHGKSSTVISRIDKAEQRAWNHTPQKGPVKKFNLEDWKGKFV